MNQHPSAIIDHNKAETTNSEPLPKVIIPETLLQQRERGLLRLLVDPPDVDCIHVLGRSGPLAAAGLYEDPDFVAYLGLPPMIVIDGIGNEVWNEWVEMMYAQDRDYDDRQMKFLVQLSKGKLDWAGFEQIDPNDIHSLDQLADYCAAWLVGYVAGVTRSETVYQLIQRYGLNLFQLHEGIQAAFKRHTHGCVEQNKAT
jgi:hypothetical protein